MSEDHENDEHTISEEGLSEASTVEELERHLELLVNVNNMLCQTIKQLEKLNAELCKIVSNVNNVSFALSQKCDEINKVL